MINHPSNEITSENLDDVFSYHGDATRNWRYTQIRMAGKALARSILEVVPKCADRSSALREVRRAVADANAAIALAPTLPTQAEFVLPDGLKGEKYSVALAAYLKPMCDGGHPIKLDYLDVTDAAVIAAMYEGKSNFVHQSDVYAGYELIDKDLPLAERVEATTEVRYRNVERIIRDAFAVHDYVCDLVQVNEYNSPGDDHHGFAATIEAHFEAPTKDEKTFT